MNLAAAKAALAHLEIDENPVSIRAKSRILLVFARAESPSWIM